MSEHSSSLVRQFRKRIAPDKHSTVKMLSEDALAEDYQFLRLVASGVPYMKFVNRLSIQNFNRIRALAISDLFEDVDEDAKVSFLGPLDIHEARQMPEYTEISEGLKETAQALSSEETAIEWVRKRGGPKARRALERVLATGDPSIASRAAAEILDREVPRAAVRGDDDRVVHLDPEAARLIGETLETHRKSLPKDAGS